MGLLATFHRSFILRLLKIRYRQLGMPIPPEPSLKKEADLIFKEVQKQIYFHGKSFLDTLKAKIKQRIR